MRPARKDDVRELSRTLARAFYGDPVMIWLFPDEKTRTARLCRSFATATRYFHLARGGVEVACDGQGIGAAALWDPPGQWQQSRVQLAMTETFIRVFGLRSTRGRVVRELMKRVHPEEPHWYLDLLGSDPSVRGKGFAHALMTSRLDRANAEHACAYLVASRRDNVPYYQRFGFEVTGEIVLPDGGPTMWLMWRTAQ